MDLNIQHIFLGLVLFVIIQRVFELFLAHSNEKYILSKGGKIIKEKNYIFMVLLHTIWSAGLLYYALFEKLTFNNTFTILAFFGFLIGQTFRIQAIRTLGKRWSTRIVILPNKPAIKKGLYSWIRHPNYFGVVLEIACLPIMASLYHLALLFSLLNLVVLYFRIKLEENYLGRYNQYHEIFFKKQSE